MGEVNLIEAVHTLRSYNLALAGMTHDPQSIASWITRFAENDGQSNFCQDAAIGLLCHLGNPVYGYGNITKNQQLWSGIFGSAELALAEELNWQGGQVSQYNLASFGRMFSTDIEWIQQYAQSLQYPLDIPFEFFVNKVIADFRTCQGSSGAGGIPHSPQTHSSMIPPVP